MRTKIRNSAADFMPHGEKAEHILRARAEQISKQETQEIQQQDGITYVRFKLGAHEFYGLPYQHIKEIMSAVPLTKLPSAPSFIGGIINRRGALLAVLDLKKFFNFPITTYEKNYYILIVKSAGVTIGILADNIEGSDFYVPTSLEPPLPSVDAIKSEYLIGLHHGITTIINIEAIMSDPQFLQMMK